MDYSGYYKLALQKTYGCEFPEMSSEEFDRRCTLPQVPEALKCLYLALGRTRICRMHVFLPAPEELCDIGELVVILRTNSRVWAVSSEDLNEENPLVQTIVTQKEDEDGTLISEFGNDGETRVALFMVNMIAQSFEETRSACASVYGGPINRFRNSLSWLTRKRLRLLTLLTLTLFPFLIFSRILVRIHEMNPGLGNLGVLFFMGLLLILICSLWRIFLYWNVWLNWSDNVRFANREDLLCFQTHQLTVEYLCWNHPELFFTRGKGDFYWNPGVSLREGPRRYSQSRYDFIMESDGEICFPGFEPIHYQGRKPLSLLLRSTLGEYGCLNFTHVKIGRKWKLPKSTKVRLAGEK